MSDHLLIVLGRLNSQAELHQRIELVESFCKVICSLRGKLSKSLGAEIINSIAVEHGTSECFKLNIDLLDFTLLMMQAIVSDVAGKSEEDICRTSALVFFTSRTGDIEIQR